MRLDILYIEYSMLISILKVYTFSINTVYSHCKPTQGNLYYNPWQKSKCLYGVQCTLSEYLLWFCKEKLSINLYTRCPKKTPFKDF